MSLEKAIKFGKEKRKPYRSAKRVSGNCRNHGGCDWCEENRLHSFKKSKDKWNVSKEEMNLLKR